MMRFWPRRSGTIFLLVPIILAAYFVWDFSADTGAKQQLAPVEILKSYDPDTRYFPGERWKKASSPELLGWSTGKLQKARNFSKQLATAAAMVIDNGIIVAEWGETRKRLKLHSVRKSILSAMFGIAVAQGQIDINRTLTDLGIDDIPPSLSEVEKQAKVSDLLKARSGVYHPAAYETKSMRRRRPDRGSHPPGTFWYYNNWDFNALLTIFEQLTGTGVFKSFKRKISDTLEMQDFRLEDTKYYRSKVSMHAAYLFRMSARDLARFGLLYLRKGRWKDKQIVPASWIRQSAIPYSQTGRAIKGGTGYGYMWWVSDNVMRAAGTGGQRLFILKEQNIIFVHRVNTDIKGSRVKSKDIQRLLDLILKAKIQSRSTRAVPPGN